jgi:hypothetical protein
VFVEMRIASLYLACLRSLESGVRVWGWSREENLSGPKPEEICLISGQLLSS